MRVASSPTPFLPAFGSLPQSSARLPRRIRRRLARLELLRHLRDVPALRDLARRHDRLRARREGLRRFRVFQGLGVLRGFVRDRRRARRVDALVRELGERLGVLRGARASQRRVERLLVARAPCDRALEDRDRGFRALRVGLGEAGRHVREVRSGETDELRGAPLVVRRQTTGEPVERLRHVLERGEIAVAKRGVRRVVDEQRARRQTREHRGSGRLVGFPEHRAERLAGRVDFVLADRQAPNGDADLDGLELRAHRLRAITRLRGIGRRVREERVDAARDPLELLLLRADAPERRERLVGAARAPLAPRVFRRRRRRLRERDRDLRVHVREPRVVRLDERRHGVAHLVHRGCEVERGDVHAAELFEHLEIERVAARPEVREAIAPGEHPRDGRWARALDRQALAGRRIAREHHVRLGVFQLRVEVDLAVPKEREGKPHAREPIVSSAA